MNKLSLVAAAVALSMVIGPAVAAVVTPQVKVPTPHIKTPTPKVTPKTGGHFEIKDFSFGVENPTTIGSATGGAGAGKVKFHEFVIKKVTDSASPVFFKN